MTGFTTNDAPSRFSVAGRRFAAEWGDCWPGADPWRVEFDPNNEPGELAQIFAPCALDPSYLATALAGGVLLERGDCTGITGVFPDLRTALLAVWAPSAAVLPALDDLAAMDVESRGGRENQFSD